MPRGKRGMPHALGIQKTLMLEARNLAIRTVFQPNKNIDRFRGQDEKSCLHLHLARSVVQRGVVLAARQLGMAARRWGLQGGVEIGWGWARWQR
jgi:hypothetical protein